MAKLTKDLLGVVAGEVYPKIIPAGEDCPVELEDAAREAGVLDVATVADAQGGDPKPKKGG